MTNGWNLYRRDSLLKYQDKKNIMSPEKFATAISVGITQKNKPTIKRGRPLTSNNENQEQ